MYEQFKNSSLATTILDKLQGLIRANNEYIQVFQNHLKHDSDKEVVLLLKKVIPKDIAKNLDVRTYAKPECTTELAAIITEIVKFFSTKLLNCIEDDLHKQHIVVETQTGQIQRIDKKSIHYDPLGYAMFFPYGEPGFQLYLPKVNGGKISHREYYRYQFHERVDLAASQRLNQQVMNFSTHKSSLSEVEQFNAVSKTSSFLQLCLFKLFSAGRLLQQYICDMAVKCEENDLRYSCLQTFN